MDFEVNGHKRLLALFVTPLGKKAQERGQGERRSFLILFEDVTPKWAPPGESASRKRSGAAERQETRRQRQELVNGGGISSANGPRIFEASFTTKGERGTGLGLCVARGIVDSLRGKIGVRSRTRPGKSGTCFSIFLPNRIPNAK